MLRIRGEGTPDDVPAVRLSLSISPSTRFRQVVDSPVRKNGFLELRMKDIAGTGLERPFMKDVSSRLLSERVPRAAAHATLALEQLGRQLADVLARQPYRAAVAFPAVAVFLWRGGKLADRASLRPVGVAAGFRLARASIGAGNGYAMGLVCRYITQPAARSAAGVSLLDLALESPSHRVAQGALEGLRKNSELAGDRPGLAELVQASMGKLVERHPILISKALEAGARMDPTTQAAWSRLHPGRRGEEADALVREAAMAYRIGAAESSAGTDSSPEAAAGPASSPAAPRRRLKLV